MIIQSFALKNYRSFVDRTTIELRPLTLLYGYNNSGKSALLRALPLIVDSLPLSMFGSNPSPWRPNTPLALDSSTMRGSSFSDLLSRITGKRELEIELSLRDHLSLKWTLRDEPQLRTHFVSRFEVWKGEKQFEYEFIEKSSEKGFYDYRDCLHEEVFDNFYFRGLISISVGDSELADLLVDVFANDSIDTLQWLSSVRTAPLRFNPFQGAAPELLKPNGEGAAAILAYDSMDSRIIFPKVSGWYEKHFDQKLVMEENGDFFQIMLQPVNAPYKVNIVDTGEGLIQVLPVLVVGAMAKAGSILAIEEPESHLQPRYHAALAEYFCELANQEEPPKVLLETHSENFLLRIQLAIAKGELDPRSVIMYWVHRLEDGRSIAEPVTFDEFARPQGEWPRDVFYTDTELSKQLVQARRELSEKL